MPPRLSRDQVRRVDRLAIDEYRIPGIVLMENAAIAAADVASAMLADTGPTIPGPQNVLILCGGGNNGGDGLAIARHLHNRGHRIQLAFTTDPAKYHGDALTNYQITQAMHLLSAPADPLAIAASTADLIIDAIFGTGLSAPPRPPFDQIAAAIAKAARPVLAIDIPSGLDCDTGRPLGTAIAATQTITFVAEKIGFANPQAPPYLGKITIASIGCPPELIARIAAEP